MNILGLQAVSHDSSAALIVDGKVVAAADEERFSRRKHAPGELPLGAARFCLDFAGLSPRDVDVVAYPWSEEAIRERRLRYLGKTLRRRPAKALRFALWPYRRQRRRHRLLLATMKALGIDPARTQVDLIPHHLAHAASAYHLSGFESAAILSIDGTGELQTTLYAEGRGRDIEVLGEELKPDSFGFFYTAMTEYLGFQANDGEYKLMGMAPYGDPSQCDLSDLIRVTEGRLRVDDRYVACPASEGYDRKSFSRALVQRLGKPRTTEGIEAPYIHVAAATQRLFEENVLRAVEHHLGDALRRHDGRLCLAGGCALNVVLNRRLSEHPLVKRIFVQPNAGDGGTSLGAAAQAAVRRGATLEPMTDCQLGPGFTSEECRRALDRFAIPFERPADIVEAVAQLLAEGHAVAWFQGRMEWGPRALGNRSVLGNPAVKGQTNAINLRVKFREAWRPFCPSVLAEHAAALFDSDHPSPFMTICFGVKPEWRARIGEVVHVDGSARPQYVDGRANPRFRALIERFHGKTGIPCVINTSMNRRNEPIVCTPEDAIRFFFGCGIEYLALEDLLVRKRPR